MAYKISINKALEESGMILEEVVYDSLVPACCSEGCMVEPDGMCEHGFSSVIMGMI